MTEQAKTKSQILNESLERNGINASMALTRKSVYEAIEVYAEQAVEELEAATAVINLILEAESGDELLSLRDSLRKQINGHS